MSYGVVEDIVPDTYSLRRDKQGKRHDNLWYNGDIALDTAE